MDDRINDDIVQLNALVDGELPPAERAAIAGRMAADRDLARAYATLARLKAAVGEESGEAPAISLPAIAGRPRRPWIAAAATCVAALAVAAAVIAWSLQRGSYEFDTAEGPTAITLASLPAGTTIPRLDTAGLKLIGLAIDPGRVPIFTATYRGPHGCRLDLRAWHKGVSAPALTGTSRHRWNAGGLVYELVAHGMPPWRFALIASAAEQQTLLNTAPGRIERRLRQADIGAPPCTG